MTQHYSNPERESDPQALPDIETFVVLRTGGDVTTDGCPFCGSTTSTAQQQEDSQTHDAEHVGWYWQPCFPGCLPDGEPNGPFDTEAEAVADAQSCDDTGMSTSCETGDHSGCRFGDLCDCMCHGEGDAAVDESETDGFHSDQQPDDEPLPPCALAMRCLCAGHARGNPASEPCDTSEVESGAGGGAV